MMAEKDSENQGEPKKGSNLLKYFKKNIKEHKTTLALTLIVFILSFWIRIQGPLNHGYPIAWGDAQVHTHRIMLAINDPRLFLTTMFGLEPKPPDRYPYNGEYTGVWFTNMNPPLLYLVSIPFLFLKDLLVGYTAAVFLSSLGISIVFLFVYRFTKDYIVSLVSSMFLSLNPAEIWYWQQGAWTSLTGIVFIPLSVWLLYEYLGGKTSLKKGVLGICLILLSYFIAVIPLLFSVLFYTIFKKSYKKTVKVVLISFLLCSIFIYASFSGRAQEPPRMTISEEFEYLVSETTPTGGALRAMPIWLCLLAAFGIILGIKFREDAKILFFYSSGILATFLFSIIALRLNMPLTPWFTRLYVILPQLCAISLGFAFVFLQKLFLQSKGYIKIYKISILIFLLIFGYIIYPQLIFFANRHAQMTDQKYDAMLWVRANTNEESTLLLFNPYEFNGYDWAMLFYRNHYQLNFDEARQILESGNVTVDYLTYDYVIVTEFDMGKGNSFLDLSKSLLLNSGYKEVYSNDEVLILS